MTRVIRGRGGLAALFWLLRRCDAFLKPCRTARLLRRYGATLPAAIALGVRRSPEKIALVRDDVEVSFAALQSLIERCARGLTERFPAGTRVGMLSEGGVNTVVVLAAGIVAGLDITLLGPRIGEQERAALGRSLGLRGMLVAEDALIDGRISERRGPGRVRFLSSGSTGSSRATARGSLGISALFPIADLDRRLRWPDGPVLVLAPVDHGHGFSAVLAALLGGQTVILGGGRRGEALRTAARRHPPTCVTGVPLQLARAHSEGILRESPLRLIVSGSSRLTNNLGATLAGNTGARVVDVLGATECGSFAVRQGSGAFRPLAGVSIAVDTDGMLRVRTPLASGWISTGDRAVRVGSGFVLQGRGDQLVDTAGELVSPEHVRQAILAVAGVRSCEIETRDDELRGAVIRAMVVMEPGYDAEHEKLRRALLPVLGRQAMPQEFLISAARE